MKCTYRYFFEEASRVQPKNRYVLRAKISERKFRELLNLFAQDFDASRIAASLELSRNTVNAYLRKIRMRLAEHALESLPLFHDLAFGESIFHVHDVRRKRHEIATASILVGILRADRTLFIEVQPGRDQDAYRMFLRGRMFVEGTTNLECWKDFRGQIDLDFDGDGAEGIAGMTGAQPQLAIIHAYIASVRTRLMKFRGVKVDSIRLHLKECEFRFNVHTSKVSSAIRRILCDNPLD